MRHIAARLPDGTELHNFYVPAGGDIPDRELNPAYGFKLDYVDAMREWFAKERAKADRMILVGDLNIAPLESDVWSHKQLLNVISHTPPEVERMEALMQTSGWIDTARHFTPEPEKLYSWWSYRNRDWRKSDRGRRLDHIWVTPPLKDSLKASHTLKDARDWERGSDHVPVMADFNLSF
jgi:exodeoxyribonuclease-3